MEDIENDDFTDSASGVYVDISDYLDQKFGRKTDKESDISDYLKSKFPEL